MITFRMDPVELPAICGFRRFDAGRVTITIDGVKESFLPHEWNPLGRLDFANPLGVLKAEPARIARAAEIRERVLWGEFDERKES